MTKAIVGGLLAALIATAPVMAQQGGIATRVSAQLGGKFQDADGGTLFLDEIGEMPLEAQVKLLRVIQTGEVHPIGARGFREVDVRIIAATNKTLLDEVEAGRFREDLYYRLAVVQVVIPPLRDRRSDIPALARQPGLRSLGITDDALAVLASYDWPGNVRQLQNALFRAAVLCEGDALTSHDFPEISSKSNSMLVSSAASEAGITLYDTEGHLRPLESIEADVIRLAIGHYRGRMTEVARRLGIGRSTLYRKLAELGISDAA
jgi:DNA-binding NtrC family response regulator